MTGRRSTPYVVAVPGGRGFVSEAQRRYMFSQHPDIAERFAAETPKNADLPEHVGDKTKKRPKLSHVLRSMGKQ